MTFTDNISNLSPFCDDVLGVAKWTHTFADVVIHVAKVFLCDIIGIYTLPVLDTRTKPIILRAKREVLTAFEQYRF